ncbi:MAG TPA: hypothetical protein VEZ90_04625 [Blastocatellia bacterium]|nr:hypothetical protein [Blastocatellia bacterium]
MSIKGSWSIGYVFYETNTANSASMNITSDSPLAGTCTIEGTVMNIAAGAIVNVFNGQWVWFTCTEPSGEQYYFMGCIDPSSGTIYGGTLFPSTGASQRKKTGGTGGVGVDPADMGGWVASHN